MNTALRVPDQGRVMYPQFDPDQEPTPAELFAEGDYWATDSLMRWCRQEENESFMIDIFAHQNANGHRDEAIKQWSKLVIKGEWV